VERARQIEQLMKDRLGRLQVDDDRIGDVRGRGAMIAMELSSLGRSSPMPSSPRRLCAGCHSPRCDRVSCGTFGNVCVLPRELGIGLRTSRLDQLHRDHRASAAHITDPVVVDLQPAQPVLHQLFDLPRALHEAVGLDRFDRRQRGRARDRIAAVTCRRDR